MSCSARAAITARRRCFLFRRNTTTVGSARKRGGGGSWASRVGAGATSNSLMHGFGALEERGKRPRRAYSSRDVQARTGVSAALGLVTMTQATKSTHHKEKAIMNFDKDLDARGLNCPLPILRAKKALTDMQSGQVLRIVSTDLGSIKDFQAFCKQTGNELLSQTEASNEYTFFLKRK